MHCTFSMLGRVNRPPKLNEPETPEQLRCDWTVGVPRKGISPGKKRIDWFVCIAFKELAQYAYEHLKKEDVVFCKGRVQTHGWGGHISSALICDEITVFVYRNDDDGEKVDMVWSP